MITTNQISWIAGILEGEGCFHFNGVTPAISLRMTDRDVVVKARDIINSKIKVHVRERPFPRKTVYEILIGSNTAIQWMMTVYSLMGERRKSKIRELLKTWIKSNKRVIGSEFCRNGHKLEKSNLYENGSCKICLTNYNKLRNSPEFKMIESISKLKNISFEEAKILYDKTNSSMDN